MPIFIDRFMGIRPKVSPQHLAPGEATEAFNLQFHSGVAVPIKRDQLSGQKPSSAKSVTFFDGTAHYYNDVVSSVFASDRTIVSGLKFPEYINSEKSRLLGFPPPQSAPAAQTTAKGDDDTLQGISFSYAWINGEHDESSLSPAVTVTVGAGGIIDLSGFRSPSDDGAIDPDYADYADGLASDYRYVLYRSGFGSAVGWFEIASFTPQQLADMGDRYRWEYDNDTAGLDVKEIYSGPTMPPQNLDGVLYHPADFLVGYKGDTVYFSETSEPSVWPPDYTMRLPGTINGLTLAIDQIVVTLEDNRPILISANGPGPGSRSRRYARSIWPCIAKDSVKDTGYGVFYITKSGVASIDGRLLTQNIIDEGALREFVPSGLRTVTYEGMYICYGSGRRFVLDPQSEPQWQMSRFFDDADYMVVHGGQLYKLAGQFLLKERIGEQFDRFCWRSGLIRLHKPSVMGAGQIRAEIRPDAVVPRVVGGIGLSAIGERAIGDTPVELHEEIISSDVRVTIYDERLTELFSSQVDGETDFPITLPKKIDRFYFEINSSVPVLSAVFGTSRKDLEVSLG